MSFKNTFETQAKEYLGIQGGANGSATVLPSGNLQVGTQSSHVQLGAVPGLSFVDFKSNGQDSPNFDARIVSITGSTGEAQAELLVQSGLLNVASRLKVGGPAFKVDYASVAATVGTNQVTTITFTAGLFGSAPVVVATANTPTGQTGDQFVHVEEVTATGFKVEYLGVAAAGTFINWIALGL